MPRPAPPGVVVLERPAGGVEAIAVQLDGQAVLRPVTIDLVALQIDVRAWPRPAMVVEQAEEARLELAEGRIGAVRPPQLGDALLRGVARDARLDLCRGHAMTHPRLVARAAQIRRRERWRDVEQRTRHGRHGDRPEGRRVGARQRRDAVHHDARLPSAAA